MIKTYLAWSVDPRVTASGAGYTVTTRRGTYHVLDSGVMGWGVYTGRNLDMVFGADGPLIGAAAADDLVKALLDADNAS